MTQPRKVPASRAEINDAALSLFEIGLGALRENDKQMAKTLIGVAEKLWQTSRDSRSAERARNLYESVS